MFSMNIRTDDATFDDGMNGATEVARILREIAGQIENDPHYPLYRTIFDVNGNDVGRYRLTRGSPVSGKPDDPCRVTITPLQDGGVHVEVHIPTYEREATYATLTVERDKDGGWYLIIPWPDNCEDKPMPVTLGGHDGYEAYNGIVYLGAPDVDGETEDVSPRTTSSVKR